MSGNTTEHKMLCIVCPEGCELEVRQTDGELVFSGKACRRGREYARQELTSPQRVLTTTVRLMHGTIPVVPARTAAPIPKHSLETAMDWIAGVVVEAPVSIGQILCADVAQTGIALIACRNVPRSGAAGS